MMKRWQLEWCRYTLHFKAPAGTSRGYLREKPAYFIRISGEGKQGLGECGLLPGLSADDRPDYEQKLQELAREFDSTSRNWSEYLREWPSIRAGLEMALLDWQSEEHRLFPTAFTRNHALQPINGLIWMGDEAFMQQQIDLRLAMGFKVLKMKIGALDYEAERAMLAHLRKRYAPETLELRVDANGAFAPEQALAVLEDMATLGVHSIEQPIAAGQWEAMAKLCRRAVLPIALDEELIGICDPIEQQTLLDMIRPQYIIIKPSFLGGFTASSAWIKEAQRYQIDWWVTSALESNVGLSAIAQWNYLQNNSIPSGLGTGSLYVNNVDSALYISHGHLGYDPQKGWNTEALDSQRWFNGLA